MSLRIDLWKRLGKEPIIHRIFLQQQLPSKSKDGTIQNLVQKEMSNPINVVQSQRMKLVCPKYDQRSQGIGSQSLREFEGSTK